MMRIFLALEIIAFFLILPVLVAVGHAPRWPLLYLYLGIIWAVWTLRGSKRFQLKKFFTLDGLNGESRRAFLRALVLSLGILLLVAVLEPKSLFRILREQPATWLFITVLYPILSAFPQEVLFRAFFFERYRQIFEQDWQMILASAVSFASIHIIYANTLAVVLSFLGGLIFAYSYHRSGHLMPAVIEHTVLGLAIFTFGFGHYFLG